MTMEVMNISDTTIAIDMDVVVTEDAHGSNVTILAPGETAEVPNDTQKRVLTPEGAMSLFEAWNKGFALEGDLYKREPFVQHIGTEARSEELIMGKVEAQRDVTRKGCNESREVLRKLHEPVEVFGRLNYWVIECHYASGFKHELRDNKPEWAEDNSHAR